MPIRPYNGHDWENLTDLILTSDEENITIQTSTMMSMVIMMNGQDQYL